MAYIELVIKMPEGLKNDFESEQWTALSCMEMKTALEKAMPLPKGHGRLIDADALKEKYKPGNWDLHKVLKNAPTIIEADNTESEVENEMSVLSIL